MPVHHEFLFMIYGFTMLDRHGTASWGVAVAHEASVYGVLAGEGGAGTWSDGKLTTKVGRNSDPVRRVLHTLHAFGAPQVCFNSAPPLATWPPPPQRLLKLLH